MDNRLCEEKLKVFYNHFSREQIEGVKKYLIKRREHRGEEYFKVVFDISPKCNLNCRGCGTNAVRAEELGALDFIPLEDIIHIFEKIYAFCQKHNVKPFIYLGGGEPLLHPQIMTVVKRASELFDRNVGIDTNATLKEAADTITEIIPYVSYVGISLNGLRDYHNWWTQDENSFDNTVRVIRRLCAEGLSDYFEVTSIATRSNIDDYESFLNFLKEIGVKKFSIHRAMPVGRMASLMNLMPDNVQYFKLLCLMASNSADTFRVHMHHSIEEIHSALLLGEGNECSKLGNPENNSSIGIHYDGSVYFDPWCTSGRWRKLSAGNLLNAHGLDELLFNKNTLFYRACESITAQQRCKTCNMPCTGGSRIAAASNAMIWEKSMDSEDILEQLKALDPACPLY